MRDHAAGVRAEDRRGRGLAEPGGDGEDASRRVESGCDDDRAGEGDRLDPPGREVDEADVGAARRRAASSRSNESAVTGDGVEIVRTGVALPTRQTATLPPNVPVAKSCPVRAPGGLGQVALARQQPAATVPARL